MGLLAGAVVLNEGRVAWDACGPVANAVARGVRRAQAATVAEASAIRARDLSRGWFTPGTGQNLWRIQDDLTNYDPAPILAFEWLEGMTAAHAQAVLDPIAPHHAVVLEVGHASLLPWSQITPNVDWHFVCLVGADGPGAYLMANGDDFTATRAGGSVEHPPVRPVTIQQLIKAQLAGILAVQTEAAHMAGIPDGWKDSAGGDLGAGSLNEVLTAPNGVPVTAGMRRTVLQTAWDARNWPVRPAHAVQQLELLKSASDAPNALQGPGTIQEFYWTVLGWSAQWNGGTPYMMFSGQQYALYRDAYDAQGKQIAQLQAQVAQLQAAAQGEQSSNADSAALNALAGVLAGRLGK